MSRLVRSTELLTWRVPQPEEVKAALKDGVLTVTFPKSTPEQAPKRIAVKVD